jgi:hypothetical protein
MSRRLPFLATLLTLAFVQPAAANDLFTLDAKATTPGRVVQDGAGNAYVGWVHEAAVRQPTFCKIPVGGNCTSPVTLPLPGGTTFDEVSGVFPILGPAETVYVVGPRYVRDDVVIWTSTNGGQSFNSGEEREGGYSNVTDPTNVLLIGPDFWISGHNPGLGFSRTPLAPGAGGAFKFANPGEGSPAGSSLAYDGVNVVESFWLFANPYKVGYYRHKGGSPESEANWEGPIHVSDGYESKLAGGPGGIFLVSQDYAGGENPSAINVRKFGAGGFAAPVTLSNDSRVDLYLGGAIAEGPGGGRLVVAWPGVRSGDNAFVMRLWTSTDGGGSFSQSEVAHIADAYAIGDNAQLSVGESGQGWLTFRDSAGLHMADLTPIAGPPAPPSAKPKRYKGPTKVTKKKVDGFLLTLRLPKRCLRQQQPFFAGVGVRARGKLKKKLRSKIHVLKVTFKFDGKKISAKKRKPFRQLISPGPLAPGSVHRVVARVKLRLTKHGRSKKVVRVLKGTISIC